MADFRVRLSAETREFAASLKGAVTNLNQHFVGGIGGKLAGLISGGAFIAAAKESIRFASQFNDSARKLGVGVEFLQEAAYAAKQTGANLGDVESALKRMQIAQVNALSGQSGNDMQSSFERLGVSLGDLKDKNVEQVFVQIASNIQKANPSAQQLADTVKIMGRSADSLLPAFRDGFVELQLEARRLGLILDSETIGRLDQMGDRLDQIGLKFKVLFAGIVLPMLQKAVRTAQSLWIDMGAPFRYWGALAGGATDKEAMKIAAKIGIQKHKELNEQIMAEEAAVKKKKSPLSLGAGVSSAAPLAAERPPSFSQVSSDAFASRGLFLTAGTAGLAQSQIGLLRAVSSKLDAIKSSVDQTTQAVNDTFN